MGGQGVVLSLTSVNLTQLSKTCHILFNKACYNGEINFPGRVGGWVVGLSENKANSAQLGWGLAELGNIVNIQVCFTISKLYHNIFQYLKKLYNISIIFI